MDFFSILMVLCAYLVGAIPTGYLIAQLKGITDIRKHGSGNIGATNVSRVLGKHYFVIILLLDAGKAYLFMHAIKHYFDFNYLCIFASILLLGNGCSIFLRGSGGKGGATLAGLLLALHAPTVIILFGIWLLLVLIIHTVGIASVATALYLPICGYTNQNSAFLLFSQFATLWIIYTHRSNIQAYWK